MKIKLWLSLLLMFAWTHTAKAGDFFLCVNPTNDAILNAGQNPGCANSGGTLVRIDSLDDGKALRSDQPVVEKAIIVVHAAGESDVFEKIKAGITDTGPEPTEKQRTWLVALRFSNAAGAGDLLWWTNTDTGERRYAMGSASESTQGVEISAFSVLDFVIRRMKLSWAPYIKEFVIVGFGRNAEFVNRYSIGTSVEGHSALKGNPALDPPSLPASVRYMMVSAGRYTYLNSAPPPETPTLETRYRYEYVYPPEFESYNSGNGTWTREKQPAIESVTCSALHYDTYPYGFTNTPSPHYMKADREENKKRVTGKQRLFLVGGADTQGGLDAYIGVTANRCPAQKQGITRLERAFNYMHHLRQETIQVPHPTTGVKHAASVASGASFCLVKGAGYNVSAMMESHAATSYWRSGAVDRTREDDGPVAAQRR